MNKALVFIVSVIALVIVLITYAGVTYDDQQTARQEAERTATVKLQEELRLQKDISNRNDENYTAVLKANNDKRLALCGIIKTTKAVYDPALCL